MTHVNESQINIAVMNDHVLTRIAFMKFLATFENFKVIIEAGNTEELLKKASGNHIHICIVDLSLQECNVYNAIKLISESLPEIKILHVARQMSDLNIILSFQHGTNGFLIPTASASELFNAVNELFYNGTYLSNLAFKAIKSILNTTRNTVIEMFSEREILLLTLCCSELSYKEIAKKMYLSQRTVEEYSKKLFTKLQVRSRIGLALYAQRLGLNSINIS